MDLTGGSTPGWTKWMKPQGSPRKTARPRLDGWPPYTNSGSASPMLAFKSTTPSPMPAEPFSSPTTPAPDPPHRNATPPSPNTPPGSIMASSHGATTWLATTTVRLFCFSPRDTPCPLSLQSAPGYHDLSCPLDPLLRAHYHQWIAARLSQRCHGWRHCASTAWGVLILLGNEPLLLAVDSSLAHDSLRTYTVGQLGPISSPHREAVRHRGLRPANLRCLLCDVVLTTTLLHKRHMVPILLLAGNYSPHKGGAVDKTLVDDPPPKWYQVTNCSPTRRATWWPAWDVILSLCLSSDPLLTTEVQSTMATR